jgi:FdhE protein
MSQTSTDLDAAMAEAGLVPGKSPQPVLLPGADLFGKRAARLRDLAKGHPLADWLGFVAMLADAQDKLVAAPAAAEPEQQWTSDLRALLAALPTLPEAAAKAAERLRLSEDSALSEMRERVLVGQGSPDDLAAAPFLTAAEQVAWTRYAAGLDAEGVTATAIAHKCPVCGQPPVVGMIQVGGLSAGLRYLHCGTCGTAWHHVRASCVACGEGGKVVYHSLEGGPEGVRAECCNSCHSTLKLFMLEKRPGCDPVADDLATMALDILVSEEGFQHIGGNPFLAMAAEG